MLINKISGHIPQHQSCAFVLEMHYLEIKIDLDIVIVMPIKLTWKWPKFPKRQNVMERLLIESKKHSQPVGPRQTKL